VDRIAPDRLFVERDRVVEPSQRLEQGGAVFQDDRRRRIVYDELRARARLEYMQPFWLSYLATALGDVEGAMEWANRGNRLL